PRSPLVPYTTLFRSPRLAQIGAYFRALLARQHPIEQYDVWLFLKYQLFCLIAIPGLHYRIILRFKAVRYQKTQVFIVFDNRYFDVLMHIFYTIYLFTFAFPLSDSAFDD